MSTLIEANGTTVVPVGIDSMRGDIVGIIMGSVIIIG